MKRKQIYSATQMMTVAAISFLTYKVAFSEIGIYTFGLWSILMISASIAKILDLSGANSTSRFISRISKNTDSQNFTNSEFIHTFMVNSTTIQLLITASAAYLISKFYSPETAGDAAIVMTKMLPFIVAHTVIAALAGGLSSALDGFHKTEARSVITIIGAFLSFTLFLSLVQEYGIIGFAISQLFGNAVVIILAWLSIRKLDPAIGWFPYRWSRDISTWAFSYSSKANIINFINLFFDPLVKLGIGTNTGPETVAIYDLATKIVTQLRAVIVSTITPYIAIFAEQDSFIDDTVIAIFFNLEKNMLRSSVLMFLVGLIALPILGLLITGENSLEFLYISIMLLIGWSTTVVSLPYFFASQAIGLIKWNLLGQCSLAGIMILTYATSEFNTPNGIFASIAIGLSVATIIQILGNYKLLQLPGRSKLKAIRCGILVFGYFFAGLSIYDIYKALI